MKGCRTILFQFVPRRSELSRTMRRAVIVMGASGDSGLLGPGLVPKCVRILLWAAIPGPRVTSLSGIFLGLEEQALLRARRQNGTLSSPDGVHTGDISGVQRAAVYGRSTGQGVYRARVASRSPGVVQNRQNRQKVRNRQNRRFAQNGTFRTFGPIPGFPGRLPGRLLRHFPGPWRLPDPLSGPIPGFQEALRTPFWPDSRLLRRLPGRPLARFQASQEAPRAGLGPIPGFPGGSQSGLGPDSRLPGDSRGGAGDRHGSRQAVSSSAVIG